MEGGLVRIEAPPTRRVPVSASASSASCLFSSKRKRAHPDPIAPLDKFFATELAGHVRRPSSHRSSRSGSISSFLSVWIEGLHRAGLQLAPVIGEHEAEGLNAGQWKTWFVRAAALCGEPGRIAVEDAVGRCTMVFVLQKFKESSSV